MIEINYYTGSEITTVTTGNENSWWYTTIV